MGKKKTGSRALRKSDLERTVIDFFQENPAVTFPLKSICKQLHLRTSQAKMLLVDVLDGMLMDEHLQVDGGVVEALGWNRYGGWRIGIRSFDGKRYYYYAHLKKDAPFAPGLEVGDQVEAGQLIGFMGRTGYSDKENTNNIETVHLHFGLQLIFDESQKECLSEIWIDVYDIVRLLGSHTSSWRKTETGWERIYPFRDLDVEELKGGA